MYTKVNGEQQVQILSPNFSISPSNEDYVLNISANGRDFSPLFAVSAGVTRLVSNVAPGSYYKLVGNQSEVVINWQRMCATEGSSFDPSVLDPYWTSAETQSAITAVEDHLFDVEQVTASALTELHEGLLEVSARTVDMSGYYTSAQTEEAIAEAVEGYATSGDMQSAFTLISETQRVAAAGLNQLEGRIDELSGATPDLSAYYTSAQTDAAIAQAVSGLATEQYVQDALSGVNMDNYYTSAQTEDAISAATSGKADAANIAANTGNYIFPKWNSQGIISGISQQVFKSYLLVNDEGTGAYFFMNSSKYETQNKALKLYTPLSAGTAGDILVSTGKGAPVWSAVTFPDVSNYVTSAQVETQIEAKNYVNSGDVKSQVEAYNYATVSQIPTVPTSNTAFTNDAGYITDAAIENLVTSAQVETQIVEKNYITSAATANMVSSTYISNIWKGTQSDYDDIPTKDPNTFYIIVNN